jgi:hypothetical protein
VTRRRRGDSGMPYSLALRSFVASRPAKVAPKGKGETDPASPSHSLVLDLPSGTFLFRKGAAIRPAIEAKGSSHDLDSAHAGGPRTAFRMAAGFLA